MNYNLTHFRTPYIKTTCEYLMDSMAWHLFKRTSANATADAIQNTWSTCSAEVALFKELLQVCFLQAFLQQPFQRGLPRHKSRQSSNNCLFLCIGKYGEFRDGKNTERKKVFILHLIHLHALNLSAVVWGCMCLILWAAYVRPKASN